MPLHHCAAFGNTDAIAFQLSLSRDYVTAGLASQEHVRHPIGLGCHIAAHTRSRVNNDDVHTKVLREVHTDPSFFPGFIDCLRPGLC